MLEGALCWYRGPRRISIAVGGVSVGGLCLLLSTRRVRRAWRATNAARIMDGTRQRRLLPLENAADANPGEEIEVVPS